MQTRKSFSAKILLFGEYSVLLGSPALSIPFSRFSASLALPDSSRDEVRAVESNRQLKFFLSFLDDRSAFFNEIINLSSLKQDIASGLFFASDIPVSYGLGSSGALCAAVYESYSWTQDPVVTHHPEAHSRLRGVFSAMESFFHGKSSGFDPLVIYLNTPLRLDGDGQVSLASISKKFKSDSNRIFLVDSGLQGRTGTLVPGFLLRYAPEGTITKEGVTLIHNADRCINALLEGDPFMLQQAIHDLSVLQLQNFTPMIPHAMVPHWRKGLSTGLFQLKLCGSGGGGYLLGFTHDIAETTHYFSSHNLPVLAVDLSS